MGNFHHKCPVSVCRLCQISLNLRVFLMLTHTQPSWPMTCFPWWRKQLQIKRCLRLQAWLSLVPLSFFWMLNMISLTHSGTHQFLTNYRTAEEVSGLPWNNYRWRFYHQVWCEPRQEPRRYSGQFFTWTRCGFFWATSCPFIAFLSYMSSFNMAVVAQDWPWLVELVPFPIW